MTKINHEFKKSIKSMLFESYSIICYKINDITNYEGNSNILNYSLNCISDNKKITLYLHIANPISTIEPQELSFQILIQNNIDGIKDISKKLYTNELNLSLSNLVSIFNNFDIHIDFSTSRIPSFSLIHGDLEFKNNKFNILDFKPFLRADIAIFAYSNCLHSQLKLCYFSIFGNEIELSMTGSPLKCYHKMSDDDSDHDLVMSLLKCYLLLLKNKFHFFESIHIEDIEKCSLDELKDMITIFQIEKI